MEKLFLFRHAEYGDGYNDSLTFRGREQARRLASLIKENLINFSDESISIWTSPSNRAKETALIIKERFLNVEVVEYRELWSDGYCDLTWLKEQVNKFDREVLIIVSHAEYLENFPQEIGFSRNYYRCGEGVLIENKKCIYFR